MLIYFLCGLLREAFTAQVEKGVNLMPETLHLVATTVGEIGPNNVWHTIRFLNGTWLRFGDVEAQAGGDRGFFQDVDCNQVRLDLHVCGVTRDLRLWHTVSRMDG